MFVRGQVQAAVSFAVSQARLADLARGAGLLRAAYQAYGHGITAFGQDDPRPPARGAATLAGARFGDLVARHDRVHMMLRWEVIAPDGTLFPILDADLALTPAGERATTLALAGVYRSLPGAQGRGPDWAGLQRVAAMTIQAFLGRVAALIGSHPSAEGNGGPMGHGGSLPPAAGAP
jgi:hypothetical protein